MKPTIPVICLAALLSACATQEATQEAKDVKQAQAAPINCKTAEGDIRMLQSEKANVAERIADGFTSIVPIGFIVGVVTQTEGEKMEMAIGEYNVLLDKKITEIKTKCDVK